MTQQKPIHFLHNQLLQWKFGMFAMSDNQPFGGTSIQIMRNQALQKWQAWMSNLHGAVVIPKTPVIYHSWLKKVTQTLKMGIFQPAVLV